MRIIWVKEKLLWILSEKKLLREIWGKKDTCHGLKKKKTAIDISLAFPRIVFTYHSN